MANLYTGNPSGTQPPASAPAPGVAPVLSIPSGADASSIASLTQAIKVLADNVAFQGANQARSGQPGEAIRRYKNARGTVGAFVDHMGCVRGRDLAFHEPWTYAASVVASTTAALDPGARLQCTTGTSSTLTTQGAGYSVGSGYLLAPSLFGFMSCTALTDQLSVYSGNYHTACAAGAEWSFDTGVQWASPQVLTNLDVAFGMNNLSTFPAGNGSRIVFRHPAGSTTWKFEVADGSNTTTVDTGVSVDTALHFFSIEFYSAAQADGGAAVVHAFVDNVLKATVTANIPSVAMKTYLGMKCTIAGQGGNGIYFMPVDVHSIYG